MSEHRVLSRPARGLRLVLILLLSAPPLARAEGPTESIDLASAVSAALEKNPGLRAALLSYQRAQQDVLTEEGRYWPSLVLEGGATHLENPGFGAAGATVVPTNDAIQLASELRHTFPWGTALALRLEGSRVAGRAQFGAGAAQLVELGPGYGLLGKLSLRQPILRGFGTGVGEALLRQARLSRSLAEHDRDQTASALLRDVMVAYWELWYAERALGIDQAAFELAVRQRDEAEKQIRAGARAPVDLYSYETRVADLELAKIASEAVWRQRAIELQTLLGREPPLAPSLHARDAITPEPPVPDAEVTLAAAVEESLEVLQLKAQLDLARDKLIAAGDADRPRLDLEAYVQAQGLGNQEVPPAFEQFASLDAVSAHVGLSFELPLSGQRLDAERRSAELAAEAIAARLLATQQTIQASVGQELLRLEQALRRIALATTTATIAERNVKARQERYDHGDGILLEVYEAQDTLRRALLSVERGRVDSVQASLRIDHLSGALLRRHRPE